MQVSNHGSITEFDPRLCGFDIGTCLEVFTILLWYISCQVGGLELLGQHASLIFSFVSLAGISYNGDSIYQQICLAWPLMFCILHNFEHFQKGNSCAFDCAMFWIPRIFGVIDLFQLYYRVSLQPLIFLFSPDVFELTKT